MKKSIYAIRIFSGERGRGRGMFVADSKGSASIFLLMISAVMVILVFAYIAATASITAAGYADSLLNLAGRSVLSEYDRDLKDEYGLFSFRGDGEEIGDKVSYYVNYTLKNKNHLKMEELQIDITEASLANTDIFEEAVTEYADYATARNICREILDDDGETGGEEGSPEDGRDGVLRNETVIDSLPSKELGKSSDLIRRVTEGLSSWKEVFESGSDKFLVDQYIFQQFKNAQNGEVKRKTFFRNEAEYILMGDLSDKKNKKKFRDSVVLLRNAANYLFIFADPVMHGELAAAAALITPGPEALLTQLLLAEAWALAEAENDMRILEHGKKVPVYKTRTAWAVDLESIVKGTDVGYIDTGSETGLNYQGYLRIFLFFQDRAVKLTRMMDLIQINMQGNYDREFLIKDNNCGFDFEAVINGRKYHYKEKY